MGVAVPSTLTACCSAGSVEELVADMLMHRAAKGIRRMAAADVRETLVQGEAAGRNMAVPVNWRVMGVEDVLEKLGAAMMQDRLASALPGQNALDNVGRMAAAVFRYSRADTIFIILALPRH
jgi:hypothetical protein